MEAPRPLPEEEAMFTLMLVLLVALAAGFIAWGRS